MEDLYIDNDDFEPYNTKIAEIDTALETRLGEIIAELQKACDAISEGAFHDNMSTYISGLTEMQGKLNEFTTKMQTDASDYFSEMVALDESVIV